MARIVTTPTESYIEDDYGRRLRFKDGSPQIDRFRFPTAQANQPRHAKASSAHLVYGTTNPPEGSTLTISGGQNGSKVRVFKFVATVAADWDVKIGADVDTTWTNMKLALEMAQAPGVGNNQAGGLYKVPSFIDDPAGDYQPWPTITVGTNSLDLDVYPEGEWGNHLILSLQGMTNPTHYTTLSDFLTYSFGHDCFPGKAGDVLIANGYIYCCQADTTPDADSGKWFCQIISTAVGVDY